MRIKTSKHVDAGPRGPLQRRVWTNFVPTRSGGGLGQIRRMRGCGGLWSGVSEGARWSRTTIAERVTGTASTAAVSTPNEKDALGTCAEDVDSVAEQQQCAVAGATFAPDGED